MLAIPMIPQLVLLNCMSDCNAGQNILPALPDMTEPGRVWCLAVLPIMLIICTRSGAATGTKQEQKGGMHVEQFEEAQDHTDQAADLVAAAVPEASLLGKRAAYNLQAPAVLSLTSLTHVQPSCLRAPSRDL